MSTNTYIDVHVIQTLPPSNVNRDDTGSPKTAVFGGVTRARVSSQAWKRATRLAFENFLDSKDLGLRTKRVVEVLLTRTASLAPDLTEDARLEAVRSVLTSALGVKLTKNKKDDPYEESGYLVFLSNLQLDSLAEAAVKVARGEEFDKKALKAIVKENNSIDLALFGRMVADVTDLRVDAAAQVAHAISVHAVENEFDYYTAIDDDKSKDAEADAGAGMIGTVEFNSSTLYRYATVSVHRLRENLGDDEAVVRGVEAFVRGFVASMPSGKQNSFANRTLPDAVILTVRGDQPVNWVGAFEEAITGVGRIGKASTALVRYVTDLEKAFGRGRRHTWVVRVGEAAAPLAELGSDVSFEEAVAALVDAIRTGADLR